VLKEKRSTSLVPNKIAKKAHFYVLAKVANADNNIKLAFKE
jgi:hypothetical protein